MSLVALAQRDLHRRLAPEGHSQLAKERHPLVVAERPCLVPLADLLDEVMKVLPEISAVAKITEVSTQRSISSANFSVTKYDSENRSENTVHAVGEQTDALMMDAVDVFRKLGARVEPVALPDFPSNALNFILSAEAAASFDDLTVHEQIEYVQEDGATDWPKLIWVLDGREEKNLVPISTCPLPPVDAYKDRGGRFGDRPVGLRLHGQRRRVQRRLLQRSRRSPP